MKYGMYSAAWSTTMKPKRILSPGAYSSFAPSGGSKHRGEGTSWFLVKARTLGRRGLDGLDLFCVGQ
jgi:hypothetical protein